MADWITPDAVHSACGDSSGQPPANLIDGNTVTYWKHLEDEYHWLIVDLGKTRMVEQIRLWKGASSSFQWQEMDVYVSDNPASWGAAVATNITIPQGSGWEEVDVTDKAGRYVKLDHIHTLSEVNTLFGYEFEVLTSALPYQANYEGGAADVATRDNVALAIVA